MSDIVLNPGVPAALGVVGVGIILTVVAVCICFVCNNFCRDGKSRCSIHYQQPQVLQESGLAHPPCHTNSGAENRTQYETRTFKDSVLVGEAPPTYQMATEYPRVHAGQYYIGMAGLSDETMLNLNYSDQEKAPPDYSLVTQSQS